MLGNSPMSRRQSVVLPAPDGDETTMRSPRGFWSVMVMMAYSNGALFDVLDLLAEALELGLHVDDARGDLARLRFAADGVHLSVDLLRQEVEPTPRWPLARQQAARLVEVRPE